jgi:hypothetical protein
VARLRRHPTLPRGRWKTSSPSWRCASTISSRRCGLEGSRPAGRADLYTVDRLRIAVAAGFDDRTTALIRFGVAADSLLRDRD